MKQRDLNRAVARAKRLEFLLADPSESVEPHAEVHGTYVIDWDELAAQRNVASVWRPGCEPATV